MTTSGWLGAMWPVVGRHLPPAPARVVEIGCGPAGGFVPFLLENGYEAVGVDPKAPSGSHYARYRVRELRLRAAVRRGDRVHLAPSRTRSGKGARPAHHHASERRARGRRRVGVGEVRRGDGAVVLRARRRAWVELAPPPPRRVAGLWTGMGRSTSIPLREHHGLHSAQELLRVLDERLDRQFSEDGPYFFSDLPG